MGYRLFNYRWKFDLQAFKLQDPRIVQYHYFHVASHCTIELSLFGDPHQGGGFHNKYKGNYQYGSYTISYERKTGNPRSVKEEEKEP